MIDVGHCLIAEDVESLLSIIIGYLYKGRYHLLTMQFPGMKQPTVSYARMAHHSSRFSGI